MAESRIITEDGITLWIDAVVSFDVTDRNTLSKYPVENGSVITENVAKDNKIISFQGVISGASTGAVIDVNVVGKPLILRTVLNRNYSIAKKYEVKLNEIDANPNDYNSTYVEDSRKELQKIVDEKKIVKLINGNNLYSNVVLTTLGFRKDYTIGSDAIKFDCRFEELNFATSQVTERDAVLGPFGPTDPSGPNPTTNITKDVEDGKNAGVLVMIQDYIKGGVGESKLLGDFTEFLVEHGN